MEIRKQDALTYHSQGRKGKIEVTSYQALPTQWDLSLAYTPGVAEPCLEIEKNPELGFDYTAKGNLVAVVSNGTAVLGREHRGAGGKARHGRQECAVQALCGYRRLRPRSRLGKTRGRYQVLSTARGLRSGGSTSKTSRRQSASTLKKRYAGQCLCQSSMTTSTERLLSPALPC